MDLPVSLGAHVRVTAIPGADPALASATDHDLDCFSAFWGSAWVPGRVVLEPGRLYFAPTRLSRAEAMTSLDLGDVRSVGVGAGRLPNLAVVTTRGHEVRLRGAGVVVLGHRIAEIATRHALSHDDGVAVAV